MRFDFRSEKSMNCFSNPSSMFSFYLLVTRHCSTMWNFHLNRSIDRHKLRFCRHGDERQSNFLRRKNEISRRKFRICFVKYSRGKIVARVNKHRRRGAQNSMATPTGCDAMSTWGEATDQMNQFRPLTHCWSLITTKNKKQQRRCFIFQIESKEIMSVNTSSTSTSTSSSSSTLTSTSTTTTITSIVANVDNPHLFLQTVTCQTIAGAFTWAAILITGYHVSRRAYFSPSIRKLSLRRFIFIYGITMFHPNRNGSFVSSSLCLFIRSFRGWA